MSDYKLPVERSALIQRLLRVTAMAFLFLALPAQAYIGPGAGISAVGSLLGLLGTLLLAVGVILFWPVRRLLKKKQANDDTVESQAESEEGEELTEASRSDDLIVSDRVTEK